MNPDIFSPQESVVLKRSIEGIRLLPVYEDPEFSEIFGLTKEELKEVERKYPDWDLHDESACEVDDSGSAIRNVFAWIMNGKEIEKEILRKHLNLSEEFIGELYAKIQKL